MLRYFSPLLLSVVCAAGVSGADRPARDTPMDRAVDRALTFLQNAQDKNDGSWRAGLTRNPAVTSLAVMAYLSAGHVPGEGKYGDTIVNGVKWVMAQQRANGVIATDSGHEMYHHGIATLMLAEVAGMIEGELGKEIRPRLERAVAVILKAQRTEENSAQGGWRYTVAHFGGSDISVTGWQIMALRAAKNLGCDVPAERIALAVQYIQRCQDPATGGFCYMPDHGVTIPCTGTSILALEICGKDLHRSPVLLRAGAYLLRNPPRWGDAHFFYSIYYGSQATFQLGDNYWNYYRPILHQVLLQNQRKNGSWEGASYDGAYGSSYCTAMAVLALTVEYRFLPIYQREESREKGRGK
jgi:hypothetical protein